jgi:predicted nucleic acid-binding protein
LPAVLQHGLPYRLLLSEDFQDGRTLGQVTFVDPFEPRNSALLDQAFG